MTPELWAEAEKWRDELTRAAKHRLGSQEEAEDVVSEVMLRCIQSCKEVSALRAMLHVSMARKCTDKFRKSVALHRTIRQAIYDNRPYLPYVVAGIYKDLPEDMDLGAPFENPGWIRRRAQNVSDWMPEDAIMLRDLTDRLTDDYAQVIWLDYLGYKQHAAADILGIEIGNYKSRLYRARKRLQQLFGEAPEPQTDQDGPEHPERG